MFPARMADRPQGERRVENGSSHLFLLSKIASPVTPAAHNLVLAISREPEHHFYIALIGPGYCDSRESVVNNVIPSTVAWATKTLSKGSLCIGGKLSMATT